MKREALAGWVEKNLFTNKAFAKAVADGSANVGNAFLYMIDRVRRSFVKQQENPSARNVAMLERLLMQAIENRSHNTGNGVQEAIMRSAEGDIFVEIEEDILSGVPEKDIPRVLSDIIQTKFHNLVEIHGQKIHLNQKTNREWRMSKDAQKLKAQNPQAYEDKIQAINQVDELLQATKDYIGEELKHVRKDNFVEFARGTVNFRVKKNGYSADVIVGTTKDGRAVLYDIVNLQNKKITDALNTSQSQGSTDRHSTSATDHSVTDVDPVVNTHSMQEGAGIFTEDGGNTAQGALLSPESMEAVRNGTWTPGRKNVEGETESPLSPDGDTFARRETAPLLSATPTFSPDSGGNRPLGKRGIDAADAATRAVEDAHPYDAAVEIDEAAVLARDGNRHGTACEQRATLDLADDYYQIASEATYNYSKNETGKQSETHQGVTQWHYFINNILFQEYGEKETTPYRVTINVKERSDGHFVYSFSAERQNKGSSTRRTLHADDTTAESGSNAQPNTNVTQNAPDVNNNKKRNR